MKSFIITVDTEGDNLWNSSSKMPISTENAKFIPRFQELCESFNFKPVWLTNYEMIMCDEYVNYIKDKAQQGLCEVGIHIHAWNNPPFYNLQGKFSGNPYLIEYPEYIMEEKFKTTYELINSKLGIKAKSHRSGRWAMDKKYFNILDKYKIICDCSYTPGISWKNALGETITGGSDYSHVCNKSHMCGNIVEVPATIRHYPPYFSLKNGLKHAIRTFLKGNTIWLRPALCSRQDMMKLIMDVHCEDSTDYLEFMIHSSELMPGGSPYFKTNTDINNLYDNMNLLFSFVRDLGYCGETLENYATNYLKGQDAKK